MVGPRRQRACGTVYTSFILGDFFGKFFDEKTKEPYNDVRSAALKAVANNWKSLYNAEIYCFQFFHRFATENMKAWTMLRWTALKFVAAPRKGPALDPGSDTSGQPADSGRPANLIIPSYY